MHGLYVHVPYCQALCPYCDFNVAIVAKPPWQGLCEALVAEIAARAPLFAGDLVSVYFGGGTPSLAPAGFFARLLDAAREHWHLVEGAEITLEVHPRGVQQADLAAFREAGINRLSLGWQSTHDRLLRVLGRQHTAESSEQVFDWARATGFSNISVDLIYAVPGQRLRDLATDLDHLQTWQPEHVSLYGLTYHAQTPFFRWRAQGRLQAVSEDLEVAMMDVIDARLAALGYEHYEVSNYARAGWRARHNSAYWHGVPYLGVGPGAHSFLPSPAWDKGWRWEGCRDPETYMRACTSGVLQRGLPRDDDGTVQWCDVLSAEQLFTERVLVGVRLRDGVDLAAIVPPNLAERARLAANRGVERGWCTLVDGRLVPTDLGMRFADALAALFF